MCSGPSVSVLPLDLPQKNSDLVIVYRVSIGFRIFVDRNGCISKNENGKSGKWVGPPFCPNDNNSFALTASVLKKIAGHSNLGATYVFPKNDEVGNFGALLNELSASGEFPIKGGLSEGSVEIPYSEEAAEFLYNKMKAFYSFVILLNAELQGPWRNQLLPKDR